VCVLFVYCVMCVSVCDLYVWRVCVSVILS